MALRVGTSGWNYPTGRGTWNGIFYPLPEDRQRGFDELAFYAERFNVVEVNSTFYGQPRANVALGWARRTPPDFEFAVKLYQKFTHPGMTTDATPIGQADVDAFKGGIDPLAAAGKLGPILAQFPSSFHRSPEAVAYLEWLLRTFAGYALAVEVRHVVVERCRGGDARVAERREAPRGFRSTNRSSIRRSARMMRERPAPAVRRRATWSTCAFTVATPRSGGTHDQAEDRYNYYYSAKELEPIADKVRQARQAAKKAYLLLNNHFSAQAVANATTLKKMLDEPVTAPMPAELVERFPDLAGVATLPRARLL